MGLTNISDRLTPSTPMEITFGAQPTASGRKITTLVGRLAAAGAVAAAGDIHVVSALGDPAAAREEVDALAGDDSEAGKMAYAFIAANQLVSTGARSSFPAFRILFLANGAADLGAAGVSLAPIKLLRNDWVVSPFAADLAAELTKLLQFAVLTSGVDRDLRGQFGTIGVAASILSPAAAIAAIKPDTIYLAIPVMHDSGPAQSIGELAAAAAGVLAGNLFPYNPIDNVEIGALLRPVLDSDIIIQDPAGDSENMLVAGLMPITVDSRNKVRIIRARNARVSVAGDGVTPATSYLDVQDIQVPFDFREDMFNILQTAPFHNKKATVQQAAKVTDAVIQTAMDYQDATAFQNVKELAKLGAFQVVVSKTQRGRFDFKLPVDVVPGNHVTAGNIELTDLTSFTL